MSVVCDRTGSLIGHNSTYGLQSRLGVGSKVKTQNSIRGESSGDSPTLEMVEMRQHGKNINGLEKLRDPTAPLPGREG
jgi:hypothetical protein